jgi:glycosyltransferase involved in cell wall biosynthesis
MLAVSIYNILEKSAWKNIDKAIFNSGLSLQRAKRKNLLDSKPTFVVYPPINLEEFNNLKISEKNYFFYPSRFNPPKRQELLIKAWREFEKIYPNEKLILAGSTENEKYLLKLKKLASGLHIEFMTNISNQKLHKLYAECKAGIFIPFVEDWGIVPLEFLSLGKPILAVDRGGYVNLLKDYKLYFPIIERGDEFLMIDEINQTLNKFMNTKMKKAKKFKLQDFSEKNFVNKIDTILGAK